MILVCGGDADPNLQCLLIQLKKQGKNHLPILVGAKSHPHVTWDFQSDQLIINGRRAKPDAAFIRYDVFTNIEDQRPESAYRAHAWYATLAAWMQAHPQVRSFNVRFDGTVLKPYVLHLAKQVGFQIPLTWLTNDAQTLFKLKTEFKLVVKPVTGGDYCRHLEGVLNTASRKGRALASPAIVQTELVAPDLRIYLIGRKALAFEIHSSELDYRVASNAKVDWLPHPPTDLVSKLRKLAKLLKLDFLAADFKMCPQTNTMRFLEVNSAPMFAAFDFASQGRLTRQMLSCLSDS